MIAFIDDFRDTYGAEPVCRDLPIAPSMYHERVAQQRDLTRLPARAQRDFALQPEIARVFAENLAAYGVHKAQWQMMWEGFPLVRCTIARLTREMGLAGAIRNKPVRTTVRDNGALCPLDHFNRIFHMPAPNILGVGLNYVATWAGFVYFAFVIDTYARRIVSCERVERRMPASFSTPRSRRSMIGGRPIGATSSIIATLGRNTQIKYNERVAQAGIEPSVGSVGGSYDNALAETINGLYDAEVIHRHGSWRSF